MAEATPTYYGAPAPSQSQSSSSGGSADMPPPPQYVYNNVAPAQFFYDKADSYVNDSPGLGYNGTEAFGAFGQPDVYTDPSQDYSWMEGQGQSQGQNQHQGQMQSQVQTQMQSQMQPQMIPGHQGHQGQHQTHGQPQTHQGTFLDPQFQQQYNQFQDYEQGHSASPMTNSHSTSPLSNTASPVPQQGQGQAQGQAQGQTQTHNQMSQSQEAQGQGQGQSQSQQQQQGQGQQPTPSPVAAPIAPSSTPGPPPKFINGEEYHFVPGLGYYPVARIPALRQHQQAAQNMAQQMPAEEPQPGRPAQSSQRQVPKQVARAKSVPKTAPKPAPKKVLDPTAQAAGAVTAQVSAKRKTGSASDMPEGDASILDKVAGNGDVAEIVRQTFVQLAEQKEGQAKVAFSAARLLLSVSETQWGQTKPDLMALCLSHCFKTFSGDYFHDFWRTMRRYTNVIVRLRAWMVFNVNKRFIDECNCALDFLVVMRLSHDTLLQFKFDKVLKKIIKLGSETVQKKSNRILEQAAQTVKAEDSSASPVGENKPVAAVSAAASSSAVTAAIAAAKAKSGKGVAKPAAKPAPKAGSFFKSLSKPETDKKVVVEVDKAEKRPVEKKAEVKAEPKAEPAAPSKPPASAFNDVMANILRVPTKRASPAASAPVETKKQKVKKKVTWRPDADLVDVRYFESEKDENRNHHLSSYRDMDKEEGRGLIGNNSEVDLDFDAVEDEGQEWYEPAKMSFGTVADDIEPNPPKRGGHGEVESSEAEVMAQRNKTSLATVYGPEDEIPDSPAEPSEASQNPLDLPEELAGREPKEMVVAERTKKMLGIMSGAYRVVPKQSFKGDPAGDNVCEAYDTVFVGESAPEKPVEQAPVVPAFDISKLPGFASIGGAGGAGGAGESQGTPPPPPPPPAAAANPLAALAALPGLQNLIPALQAAANPVAAVAGMPPMPGLPAGVDPMAFVQALAQMQQQNQGQGQQGQQQVPPPPRYDRYDRNDRHDRGNVSDMRKRDVRPDIARSWDKLPANRYSQPCRFFNTDKACSRGDQCIFLHLPK
ncbi:hypothetical protein CKK34_3524 [Yarrowia sp. E02]|nr:hypothetical protein CKK34_3524 [Yarrowia sp. E02]